MVAQIIFNGTNEEKHALIQALNSHCQCEILLGMRKSTCSVHKMLINDQRALNGLLMSRRRAPELILQEFLLPKAE